LQRNDEKGFWAHEFDKHGSCANSTFIKNEHDYFASSIKLQKQINLVNMLAQGGITPGSSPIPANNVFQAVQAVTGSSPQLHCIGQKLVELRVCVDKNLQYTNCDQHEANCGSTITLPNFK
jgi:ribonuclease T2